MAISAGGKLSSAVRDLAPIAFFGVGGELDQAVLGALVGSLVGSMAIAIAIPLCLPLLAQHDPRASSVMRTFLLAFVGALTIALLLEHPMHSLLGISGHSGASFLYRAAIAGALLQACTALLSVRLYARRASHLGLGMPFFAGLFVPVFLWVEPSLSSLGAALLAGSALDLAVMFVVTSWKLPSRATTGPAGVPASRLRAELLVLSQLITIAVVFGERALMARGAVGVVGAVAIAARASAAIVTIGAGSVEPQVIRRMAAGGLSGTREFRWLVRGTALAGLVTLSACAVLVGAVLALDVSVLTAALLFYSAALPSLIGHRLVRAVLFGGQAFGVDLFLVCVGGLLTLGTAAVALASDSDPIFALAIPLSSGVVAMAAGSIGMRRYDVAKVEGV